MRPLCIDLFCGLGGWTEGFLAEGYDVIGFDIERRPYPGQLVIQDVLTLDGGQFRNADIIVASPPCQAYSYRAMPWKRAKALPPPDNTLFDACFRIQREASEAVGRYIPMVVENVCGAQKWVGRAKWHFGSFYLWGDVPAIMPFTSKGVKVSGLNWSGSDKPEYVAKAFNTTAEQRSRKNTGGLWFSIAHNTTSGHGQNPDGRKLPGNNAPRMWAEALMPRTLARKVPVYSDPRRNGGKGVHLTSPRENLDGLKFGGGWWHDSTNNLIRKASSRSQARKQASAEIAKIPFELASHIARVYKP